jgi:hypothetical protein
MQLTFLLDLGFIARIPRNWFLTFLAVFGFTYGSALLFAVGFAILAIIKEKPRRRATFALAASAFIFLTAALLTQYFAYLAGSKL